MLDNPTPCSLTGQLPTVMEQPASTSETGPASVPKSAAEPDAHTSAPEAPGAAAAAQGVGSPEGPAEPQEGQIGELAVGELPVLARR